jgi:signal transduction histidine kinase
LAQARADLASAREALARAEGASAAKDELLAVVAHELRAPLGAILGWAHMLRRGGNDAEIAHGLEVIEQSAQVQSKLIEDLLDMTRMASGRVRLETAPVQLPGLIASVVEAMRPAADAKRIELRTMLATDVPPVRGDSTRLRQVVANLLTNAVKFTPDGGHVDIALRQSGGFAVIRVADTGVGIAQEFLPHVFERFRQDPDASRGQGGLGLGLAIVRHLVELHGGEIEARSEGLGQGAVFTVRLPIP